MKTFIIYLFLITSLSAIIDPDCYGTWDGHDYLIEHGTPVIIKHKSGIVILEFTRKDSYVVGKDHYQREYNAVVIEKENQSIRRLSGSIDNVRNSRGYMDFSEETGCYIDFGVFKMKKTYAWGQYVVLTPLAKDDEGIYYLNYLGNSVDELDIESLKQFMFSPNKSYDSKMKVWVDVDGRAFEGRNVSQNETMVIIDRIDGVRCTVDKERFSRGDLLFIERAFYAKTDMRDINSRRDQYLREP